MSDIPRIACLEVLLFPLAARLRSEPELREEAVAVLEGQGSRARVLAATRRARRAGIAPGQTLGQARARLPRLVARARDRCAEQAAQEALLDVAESFSPRVEDAGDGRIYLDVTGLARHYPEADDPERALADGLVHQVERRAELVGRIGIASSKLAARLAAGAGRARAIVPPGREIAFLAPMPLTRLLDGDALLTTLERWGIRSAGDLADLPVDAVTSRLGEAGRRLHALARGLDPEPLIPREPPPAFVEGMELEWPLTSLEAFGFIARAALERLAGRMAAHGLGCLRLDLALVLEPIGHHERSLTLPAPTRDTKTLLTLLRLDLERVRPDAPVSGFTLTAHPDRPRAAQLTLFGPDALSPERLATTLARLFALLGEDRAGAPATVDAHRPERFALSPYAPPPPPTEPRSAPPGHGLLAVRVLRPPVPLAVRSDGNDILAPPQHLDTAEDDPPDTPPRRPPGRGRRKAPADRPARRPRITGRVRIAAGPWQLAEGWWTDAPIDRVYWDVELDRGGLYRIYRDKKTGDWLADGVYD